MASIIIHLHIFLSLLLHYSLKHLFIQIHGIFKGFHKKSGVGHFGGKGEHNTDSRITKKIILENPIFSNQSHRCLVNHNNMDINELILELPLSISHT